MDVFILYRDIRTYGQREALYREAREKGVIFIRYDLDHKPKVQREGDQLAVLVRDHILDREIQIGADLLVLASAIVPGTMNPWPRCTSFPLMRTVSLWKPMPSCDPLNSHRKVFSWRAWPIIPKPIEESVAQAKAAASRASVVLSKETLSVEGVVSHVNEHYCIGCGMCGDACPYGAIGLVDLETGGQVSRVQPALCKGMRRLCRGMSHWGGGCLSL